MIPILSLVPLKWWIIGGVAVAVFGYGAYKKSSYDESKREEGRAEVRVDLLPVMRAQTKRLDEDRAAFEEVSKAMATIKARSQEIERAKGQARTLQQQREAKTEKDIADARAFVPEGNTKLERLESLINQHLPGMKK